MLLCKIAILLVIKYCNLSCLTVLYSMFYFQLSEISLSHKNAFKIKGKSKTLSFNYK